MDSDKSEFDTVNIPKVDPKMSRALARVTSAKEFKQALEDPTFLRGFIGNLGIQAIRDEGGNIIGQTGTFDPRSFASGVEKLQSMFAETPQFVQKMAAIAQLKQEERLSKETALRLKLLDRQISLAEATMGDEVKMSQMKLAMMELEYASAAGDPIMKQIKPSIDLVNKVLLENPDARKANKILSSGAMAAHWKIYRDYLTATSGVKWEMGVLPRGLFTALTDLARPREERFGYIAREGAATPAQSSAAANALRSELGLTQ